MPNLANIISVIRCKIHLVLKGIKVIRIYMVKLVELAIYLLSSYFFFLLVSFVLPLCLWFYLVLETSASRERYSRDIGRRVQGL
jgi:hypothetical protein